MGKYDKNNIHDWVVKKLPKNPVIIEAGVYDGSDTAWFATKFPEGQIYGFEPLDEPFNMAYNRLNHFPNVTLSKYALGPKTGNGIMHECDWKSGSSSLRKPTGTLTFHPSIKWIGETQVNSIKNFFSNKTNLNVLDELEIVLVINSSIIMSKNGLLKDKTFRLKGVH